jgi:hypothetical protein
MRYGSGYITAVWPLLALVRRPARYIHCGAASNRPISPRRNHASPKLARPQEQSRSCRADGKLLSILVVAAVIAAHAVYRRAIAPRMPPPVLREAGSPLPLHRSRACHVQPHRGRFIGHGIRTRPRLAGKHLFVGGEQPYSKAVAYGRLRSDEQGNEYDRVAAAKRDFRRIRFLLP